MIAKLGERLDADASSQFVDPARQHQHQGERKLGARDVGAAPDAEQRDTVDAGRLVYAAKIDTVFLHGLQLRGRHKIVGADGQRLDDEPMRIGEIAA